MVKELIGDRSIRQTSADTGVAASYINGILRGKYLPSAETLRKLAVPDSKLQNGVLLEDLMLAAGYQTQYTNETVFEAVFEELSRQVSDDNRVSAQPNEEMLSRIMQYQKELVEREADYQRKMARRREKQMEGQRFEKLVKGLLYQEFIEKVSILRW